MVVVKKIQQEKVEQKRLEWAQQWAEAEAEVR